MAEAHPSGRRSGFVYAAAPRPPEDDWIAVVAESFIVLLEPGAGDAGLDALAELAEADHAVVSAPATPDGSARNVTGPSADLGDEVDVGPGVEPHSRLEAIVSAIPAGELGVDSFAVVHVDGRVDGGWQVTAVAKGRAVADIYSVGGARRFSSSGVQPWLIATFRDVVGVELGGPARRFEAVARRSPGALQVETGTGRVGSLLWTTSRQDAVADGQDMYVRPPAALDDDTVLIGEQTSDPVIGPSLADNELGEQPGRLRADDGHPRGFDEETVERRHVRARHDVRSEPDERTVERASLSIGDPERDPRGSAASPRTADNASGIGGPFVPHPAADWPSTEGSGSQDQDPDEAPMRVFVGIRGQERAPLDAPVVYGRRPSAARRSGVEPVLVTVPSPAGEISASHVRIERTGRVVVVTDLRSRNGTTVSLEGRRPRRLRPGEAFAVPGAASVEIGDGTIIDITPVGWLS